MEKKDILTTHKLVVGSNGKVEHLFSNPILPLDTSLQFDYAPFISSEGKHLVVTFINAFTPETVTTTEIALDPVGRTEHEFQFPETILSSNYPLLAISGSPGDTIYVTITQDNQPGFISLN